MNINLNLDKEETKFGYIYPGNVFCYPKLSADNTYIKTADVIAENHNTWNAITAYNGVPAYFIDSTDVIHLKNAELNLFKDEREK